jgi:hypothetical protein
MEFNAQLIWEMVNRTNLTYATCRELLRKSWTYKEEFNKPSVWIHPSAKLEKSLPNNEEK